MEWRLAKMDVNSEYRTIMGSVSLYQLKKIVLILVGFSFSVSRFLLSLRFRLKSSGVSVENEFNGADRNSVENSDIGYQSDGGEEGNDVGDTVKGVEEKGEVCLTFRFPRYEEFARCEKEKGELFGSDFVGSKDTHRCEFMVGKSDCFFIEESKVVGNSGVCVPFEIEEDDEEVRLVDGDLIEVFDEGEKTEHSVIEDFSDENVESPVFSEHDDDSLGCESEKDDNFLGNQESSAVYVHDEDSLGYESEKDHNFLGNQESSGVPVHVHVHFQDEDPLGYEAEKDFNFLGNQESPAVSVHDEDSLGYETDKDHSFLGNQESPDVRVRDEDSSGDQIYSPLDGGFLSEGDFVEGESDNEETKHFVEEDSTIIDNGENSESSKPAFLSVADFHEDDESTKISNKMENNEAPMDMPASKNTNSKDSYSFADANKLEDSLWEHEELIELLHMELRKAKKICLPTILEEESEFPDIVDDFKPLKSDEKFHHEKCMDELQKFYKIYTQLMKKLDIFNHQKMYAIGFLRLKDPLEIVSIPKTSSQMSKSMFPESFRQQFKHKVHERDPQEKFIKEMQNDLELVYVGQMCLSWELLRWQYEKALDLWDYDPPGIHRYNEVAGEFQRFQVLTQRFVEDEPFQEPRVKYYFKSRHVNRNLLQVPLIREDSSSSKNRGERSEYVVTSDQLVEIIEESIRILSRFIRADKDTCSSISKGHKGILMQLQNSADFELLKDIIHVLQKKEKKLKDTRSGKFIFGKIRACREEEDSEQGLRRFYSEVDMKLVRRVLNMSKITSDQLLWCQTKLSRICFEHRKLNVDSSFLPFPVNIT